MSTQYLEEKDYESIKETSFSKKFELISTDTYNEVKIMEKIQKMNPNELLGISLNFAIVGFGGKSYGKVKIGEEMVDIKDYMTKKAIIYNASLNTKLEEDDLTPRRLIRFFRFFILDYLKNHKDISTYFYRKYVEEKNETTRTFMFPGVEHLLKPEEHVQIAKTLIKAYRKLDRMDSEKNKKPINITDRIIRVLNARGFNPTDLE
eukprot:TRINITY_DN3315_c0_g1_i3.p1 TRINITY_DN3315_c0_g1~~TRINITY_DN3315_c0_g1_i3.p1  ORF type:complete len:205 (-),score=0.36 TRINITY_DN3315_c0_g1_i3:43-657(-)